MKKNILLIMVLSIVISILFPSFAFASKTINGPGNWKFILDDPERGGKNYRHVHFFEGKQEKFCWRLDTGNPCDYNKNKKYYKSFDELPNKVKKAVSENKHIQDAIKKEKGKNKVNSWLNKIPKWALVSVAVLAAFLATVTWCNRQVELNNFPQIILNSFLQLRFNSLLN